MKESPKASVNGSLFAALRGEERLMYRPTSMCVLSINCSRPCRHIPGRWPAELAALTSAVNRGMLALVAICSGTSFTAIRWATPHFFQRITSVISRHPRRRHLMPPSRTVRCCWPRGALMLRRSINFCTRKNHRVAHRIAVSCSSSANLFKSIMTRRSRDWEMSKNL